LLKLKLSGITEKDYMQSMHLEELKDRDVIPAIQENLYMQSFIGLKEFTILPVFHPSLLIDSRKRAGDESYDSLKIELIKSFNEKGHKKHNRIGTDKSKKTPIN